MDSPDHAAGTAEPSERSEPRGASLARRLHLPRTVGLGLGGVCVGAALLQHGALPWLWALLAFNGLLWPHLAWLRASRSREPFAAEHRNLLIDSAFGGFWLPAMGLNVLPSVLIGTMLTMNNIGVGGWRLGLRGLLAQLVGAVAGWALLGLRVELTASLPTILACLPFLVVYPLTIGATNYRLSMRLSAQRREIERSERLHRSTLDAMEAGIALYDADERLVLCNREFRALYAGLGDALERGMRFEDLLRQAVDHGLVPEAAGRAEAWIEERLRQHAEPAGAVQRELPGDHWRRIVEQRLPDGSLLAFSTDVTDLVRKERALEAARQEAQQAREHLQEANDALRDANARLERLAETDALTGLANRRRFDRRLHEEWQRAQRHGLPLALLLVDVDHFKRFNDTYGHPRGDECLRQIALVLESCSQRAGDLVARYGGEEFALLLPHSATDEARVVAERCLREVHRCAIAHASSPTAGVVTLSIGVAVAWPSRRRDDPAWLVAEADRALYAAKQGGRDRVAVADA
jgi:diguanylate cyclase (GGDEF)-like protein